MRRIDQLVLVGSFLPLCWLGTISRTDLSFNPHPLLVVWAGPVLGVLLPMAGVGDAGDMLRHGSPAWQLWHCFGVGRVSRAVVFLDIDAYTSKRRSRSG
jgi:hypothetical protein